MPPISPYIDFLGSLPPYSGFRDRGDSISPCAGTKKLGATPTPERCGDAQAQTISKLDHTIPVDTSVHPLSYCKNRCFVPIKSMHSSASYLSSQLSSISQPALCNLQCEMTGQYSFWGQDTPSTQAANDPMITPYDALGGDKDSDWFDSSSFIQADGYDNVTGFVQYRNDNAPHAIQGKQEHEAPESPVLVLPMGSGTINKKRHLNRSSRRRISKSQTQLVLKVSRHGRIDVKGYELDIFTGKREPTDGLAVKRNNRTWRECHRTFMRSEHLDRHYRSHLGIKDLKCRVEGCLNDFDRRDNYWVHSATHIRIPGKKGGRNTKIPLSEMIKYVDNERHMEFLKNWVALLNRQ